ncbi:MAG: hypothetical protein F4Y88_03515 [Chloroflexi bacterium]|nr:hypothetical protein [Chloroflexota bacterium]
MEHYYVDRNPTIQGIYRVHREGCDRLPSVDKRTYLGMFRDCHGAVEKAGESYLRVDGCAQCAPECRSR